MKNFISNLLASVIANVVDNLMWNTDTFEDVGRRFASGFISGVKIELDNELVDSLDYDKALVALSAVIKKNLPKTKSATTRRTKKGF